MRLLETSKGRIKFLFLKKKKRKGDNETQWRRNLPFFPPMLV